MPTALFRGRGRLLGAATPRPPVGRHVVAPGVDVAGVEPLAASPRLAAPGQMGVGLRGLAETVRVAEAATRGVAVAVPGPAVLRPSFLAVVVEMVRRREEPAGLVAEDAAAWVGRRRQTTVTVVGRDAGLNVGVDVRPVVDARLARTVLVEVVARPETVLVIRLVAVAAPVVVTRPGVGVETRPVPAFPTTVTVARLGPSPTVDPVGEGVAGVLVGVLGVSPVLRPSLLVVRARP